MPYLWLLPLFAICLAAWRLHWLSRGGAVAAGLVGLPLVLLGDWRYLPPLLTAFISCSLLSRLPPGQASGGRSAAQVAANAGLAGLAAAGACLQPHPVWPLLYTCSLAGLAADTWASELGSRYGGRPRRLTNGRPLPAGSSGGVSRLGNLAGLAGAATVAGSAWWLLQSSHLLLLSILAGLLVSLLDSLLGATVQARFRCRVCQQELEEVAHCQQPAELTGGWRWLRNDLVNGLSIVLGSGIVLLFWALTS